MIKLAIIDDSQKDIKILKNFIQEYSIKNQCDFHLITDVCIDNIIDDVYELDIILLDVLLEKTTGIEEAKRLHHLNQDLKIIFCSTNRDYSIDAFEVNGFRYLVKPILKVKLFDYLDDARKLLDENIIEIIDTNQRNRKISQTNICYIDMFRRISIVHLKDGSTISIIRSMKEWKRVLNDKYFMISHKGILVNVRQVKEIEDNMIVLKNNEKVYLSRNYKKR